MAKLLHEKFATYAWADAMIHYALKDLRLYSPGARYPWAANELAQPIAVPSSVMLIMYSYCMIIGEEQICKVTQCSGKLSLKSPCVDPFQTFLSAAVNATAPPPPPLRRKRPGQQAPAPMYHYPPPICIDPSPDARVPLGAPTMPSAPFPAVNSNHGANCAPPVPPPAVQPFPSGVADPAQNNYPSPAPPPPAHGNGSNNVYRPSAPSQHVPGAYPPPSLANAHVVAPPPEGSPPPLGGPITPPGKNYKICHCYRECEGKQAVLERANNGHRTRSEMFDIPAEPPLRRSVTLPYQPQNQKSPAYYMDEHGCKISIPPNCCSGHNSSTYRHHQTRHVEFTTDESGDFAVELVHGCGSCGKRFRVASGSGAVVIGRDNLGASESRSCDQCLMKEMAGCKAGNNLQVRLGEEEKLKHTEFRETKKEQIEKKIRAEIEREYAKKLETEKALKLQATEAAKKEVLLHLAHEKMERKHIQKEVEIEIERRRLEQIRIEEEAKQMETERVRIHKQAEIDHERKQKEDEYKVSEAFKQIELNKEVERRMKIEDERAKRKAEEKILREAEECRKIEARRQLHEKIKRDIMEEEAQKEKTAYIVSQAARLKDLENQQLKNAQKKSMMEAERDILKLKIQRELEAEERTRLSFETMEKLSCNQEKLSLLEKALAEQALKEVIRKEEYQKMKEEAELRVQVQLSQEATLEKAKIRQQLIEENAAAQFAKEACRVVDNGNKPEWKEANPPLPVASSIINPVSRLGHFSNSPLRDSPPEMFTNNSHITSTGTPPPPPHGDKLNLQWETNYKNDNYGSKQWTC
ncbi:hypothetical protein C7212DRAFT_360739 [Tuber magnatum]|uniref:Uncharacterized protein n=1 Tax=Tuber magnatum TaxID=42249 RepID=A0A317T1I7_9PEZI|nr:hypothetical protein C7212DRAFT_360739 [Tuber magnatum]